MLKETLARVFVMKDKTQKSRFPTLTDNIFGSVILIVFAYFLFSLGQELNLLSDSKLVFLIILIVTFILGYFIHIKLTPDREHLLSSFFTKDKPEEPTSETSESTKPKTASKKTTSKAKSSNSKTSKKD